MRRMLKLQRFVLICFGFGLLPLKPTWADGFVCTTSRKATFVVKIYHHVHPELGTRRGAVMVVSNPLVPLGERTIARFADENGLFDSQSGTYRGKSDLRFNDLKNYCGRSLVGRPAETLNSVEVKIDSAFDAPIEPGARLDATVWLNFRDGKILEFPAICRRYVKLKERRETGKRNPK